MDKKKENFMKALRHADVLNILKDLSGDVSNIDEFYEQRRKQWEDNVKREWLMKQITTNDEGERTLNVNIEDCPLTLKEKEFLIDELNLLKYYSVPLEVNEERIKFNEYLEYVQNKKPQQKKRNGPEKYLEVGS